jgi:hypothetical protein
MSIGIQKQHDTFEAGLDPAEPTQVVSHSWTAGNLLLLLLLHAMHSAEHSPKTLRTKPSLTSCSANSMEGPLLSKSALPRPFSSSGTYAYDMLLPL